MEELRNKVAQTLITKFDFSTEDADEAIEGSDAGIWTENSDPEDIAKYLASDDELA